MFEIAFVVGITAAGIAITVWLLRRGTKDAGTCSGCSFAGKGITERPEKRTR